MFNWVNKKKGSKPSSENKTQPRPGVQRHHPSFQGKAPPHPQRNRPPSPQPNQKPIQQPRKSVSGVTVYFNQQVIRCVKSNGDVEALRWDQLAGVLIMVSTEGPFASDMFWVMAGRTEGGCVFPNTAAGAAEIIRYMQDNLTGFDNAEVIKAMESKENKKFVIWKARQGSS